MRELAFPHGVVGFLRRFSMRERQLPHLFIKLGAGILIGEGAL